MEMVSSLVGVHFWLLHYCDFRGRVYQAPHLNYVGRPDYIRALFRFAHGEPITKWGLAWLKRHVAKMYKGSRDTFQERYDWTEERLEQIRAVAASIVAGDYMAEFEWIKHAHDPCQFVAACMELTKALDCDDPASFVTTLPITFDATCSGSQHYSLLGRNENGFKLTNLLASDSDEVECLYMKVWQQIEEQIENAELTGEYSDEDIAAKWWLGRFDRKLFKRLVMISTYGAGKGQLRSDIYDELFERGYTTQKTKDKAALRGRIDERELISKDAVNYLVEAVQRMMQREEIGAPAIRLFLRRLVEVLGEQGRPLVAISPTGFPFVNLCQEPVTTYVQTWLGNQVKRNVLATGYGKLLLEDALKAISPNFIHMMDASLMAMVANACKQAGFDIVAVHDNFGCLASRAEHLREILLDQIYRLYAEHDPLGDVRKSAAQALGTAGGLPAVPPRGDFDLNQLQFARYAFS
jgi:DNA-directed RNA polymerase, mitochondrial